MASNSSARKTPARGSSTPSTPITTASMPLAVAVAVPVVAALATNALIYWLGWNDRAATEQQRQQQGPLPLPPGAAIAAIWVVLFALLGYAAWLARGTSIALVAIVATVLMCLAYPFVTRGLQMHWGVVANKVTLVAGFSAAIVVAAGGELTALAAMAPLLGWLAYVNLADALGYQRALLAQRRQA